MLAKTRSNLNLSTGEIIAICRPFCIVSEPSQIEECYNLPFTDEEKKNGYHASNFLKNTVGVITYRQTTMNQQKNTSATLIILNRHLRNWAVPKNIQLFTS